MKNGGIILAINGGSSSIKYAVFEGGAEPRRTASGQVERVEDGAEVSQRIIAELQKRVGSARVAAIAHRIVHGGPRLLDHQLITPEVMVELRRIEPMDLAHLPRQIGLIEAVGRGFAGVAQVACFDTEFFKEMPAVARRLPIPRKFAEAGMRRFGFHGLSYTYLNGRLNGKGRVILAHLGSGASMAAVRDGKPIDTTMGFTAMSGLVMGTRPGDLDVGAVIQLMRTEKMDAGRMDEFLSTQCGMLGVSQTSSDMRDLLAWRGSDVRAAEAVELFCYQARKYIGAYFAVLGGLDTLVFSGGIGEHLAAVRAGICAGLEGLGIELDADRNAGGGEIISGETSRVVVRVIATDEEQVMAVAAAKIIFRGQ